MTTIENNKLTYKSTFNTHVFEIVDRIPTGYFVWNIGGVGIDGYIPLAEQGEEKYTVNPNTLKVIRVPEEMTKIMNDAASCGVRTLKDAERALRSTRRGARSDRKRKFAELTIETFRAIS